MVWTNKKKKEKKNSPPWAVTLSRWRYCSVPLIMMLSGAFYPWQGYPWQTGRKSGTRPSIWWPGLYQRGPARLSPKGQNDDGLTTFTRCQMGSSARRVGRQPKAGTWAVRSPAAEAGSRDVELSLLWLGRVRLISTQRLGSGTNPLLLCHPPTFWWGDGSSLFVHTGILNSSSEYPSFLQSLEGVLESASSGDSIIFLFCLIEHEDFSNERKIPWFNRAKSD